MANRGKSWLPVHDALMMQKIQNSNQELADILERTPHGVECHRARLAVDLKKIEPRLSIEECCDRFHSDIDRVHRCMDQKKISSNNDDCGPRQKRSRTHMQSMQPSDIAELQIISEAAECIQINGGSLAEAWADSRFTAILIKHFAGFEGYASTVRSVLDSSSVFVSSQVSDQEKEAKMLVRGD